MHRLLSISVIAGLALGAGGSAMAQSRTVSTANMPKPGVSYIAGPSGPVNTVSTGFLPQPPHLTVGAQVRTGSYESQTTAYANGDGGWVDQGGSYGGGYYSGGYGNYPPGYGNDNGYGNHPGYGHGHDHDNDHGHGGNGHDHGGNGYPSRPPGNSVSVGVKPQPVTNNGGYAIKVAPSRPPPRNNGNNGWNNNPSPPPGSGMGNGFQPGTGVPVNTVNPGNGYGHGR